MQQSYSFSFTSPRPANEIFATLMDIGKWWYGVFDETIEGSSGSPGDEFTFLAGGGLHYSKQKLIELVPGKKISWEIIDSKLSFLEEQDEWTGTKIGFELQQKEDGTLVSFTHLGLMPALQCYDSCSGAWTQYLRNLQEVLG